jgi:hypothetical protein
MTGDHRSGLCYKAQVEQMHLKSNRKFSLQTGFINRTHDALPLQYFIALVNIPTIFVDMSTFFVDMSTLVDMMTTVTGGLHHEIHKTASCGCGLVPQPYCITRR